MRKSYQCGEIDVKTVAIIALFELICLHIIYSCVYHYSNIKNVVDAFGFGGTLVGILVGIIAIIYAFYQGAAQQQTNNTMVAELTKLASIKEEIANSSMSLKTQLQGLSAFADSLDTIDRNVVSSRSAIIEEIGAMLSKQEGRKLGGGISLAPPTGTEARSYLEFLKKYITQRNDILVLADAYILKAGQTGRSYSDCADELFATIKSDDEKFDYLSSEFFMYSIAMIVLIYQTAGILTANFGDGKVSWTLNEDEESNRLELIECLRKHVDAENRSVLKRILMS